MSKGNLPGYVGFFQFLRNFRQRNAFEQAELILQVALDPTIASRAKKGEFVTCFDHLVAPQLNVVTSTIARSDVVVPVQDARAASVVPSVAAAHETPTVLGPSSNGR